MPVLVLEKDIEKPCVKLAKDAGWEVLKIQKRAGWPDRLFLGPKGEHFFAEFKRPMGVIEPLQIHIQEKLSEMKHAAFIIDNVEDFKCIFNLIATKHVV